MTASQLVTIALISLVADAARAATPEFVRKSRQYKHAPKPGWHRDSRPPPSERFCRLLRDAMELNGVQDDATPASLSHGPLTLSLSWFSPASNAVRHPLDRQTGDTRIQPQVEIAIHGHRRARGSGKRSAAQLKIRVRPQSAQVEIHGARPSSFVAESVDLVRQGTTAAALYTLAAGLTHDVNAVLLGEGLWPLRAFGPLSWSLQRVARTYEGAAEAQPPKAAGEPQNR